MIDVRPGGDNHYNIVVPGTLLGIMSKALKRYSYSFCDELNKHNGCGSVSGCLLEPGNTCDAALASLYASLAEIHGFINRAQGAGREAAYGTVIDGQTVNRGTGETPLLFDPEDMQPADATATIPRVRDGKGK